jgi:hypothetical protein
VIINDAGDAATRFRPTAKGAELARNEAGDVRLHAPDEALDLSKVAVSDAAKITAQRLDISPEKVQALLDQHAANLVPGATKVPLPPPSTYLSEAQLAEHAKTFENGGSRLTLRSNLDQYGLGQRDGTTFISTRSDVDALIARSGGDLRKIEDALGLPQGQLDKSTLVRVDFTAETMKDLNFRMPSGNEAGANSKWLPGGYVPDGSREAVIDGASAMSNQYKMKDIN